jgi:hypothetical protein
MYLRVTAYTVMGVFHVAVSEVLEDPDCGQIVSTFGGAFVPTTGIDTSSSRDMVALLGESLLDLAYDRPELHSY